MTYSLKTLFLRSPKIKNKNRFEKFAHFCLLHWLNAYCLKSGKKKYFFTKACDISNESSFPKESKNDERKNKWLQICTFLHKFAYLNNLNFCKKCANFLQIFCRRLQNWNVYFLRFPKWYCMLFYVYYYRFYKGGCFPPPPQAF